MALLFFKKLKNSPFLKFHTKYFFTYFMNGSPINMVASVANISMDIFVLQDTVVFTPNLWPHQK